MIFDRLLSWLYTYRIWGRRCSSYEPDCQTCQHWQEHDELFNEVKP